jgi:hypothetical protein
VSFKVDAGGIRELGASTELRNFMRDIGRESVDVVKDLAPVDTGKLRDSVGYKIDREDGTWVVHVYFDKFYGMFKEFGTAKLAATPFLRPGVLKVIGRLGGRLGGTGPG